MIRAIAALVLFAGCSRETAVFVVVDAQDLGRLRGVQLRVRAFGPDGEVAPMPDQLGLEDGGALPRVIRLRPRDGDASRRWALRATLEDSAGDVLVESQIAGSFVAGAERYALLCLEDECFGYDCAGESCDPVNGAGCAGCSEGSCAAIEAELSADADQRCPPRPPSPESFCADGVDDDFDRAIDCEDADCDGRPCDATGRACVLGLCECLGAAAETSCSDGLDEDCDGGLDCADPECAGLACDDGDPCTGPDVCGAGCTGAPCDDGVACTMDLCDASGCSHVPDARLCDDGVACTMDLCDGSGCSHVPDARLCDDGVACTTDLCDASGCTHAPDARLCDDGNECTDDGCNASGCAHAPREGAGCADDGNSCTSDVCSGTSCVHPVLANGTRCNGDDRNSCCDGACAFMGDRLHCGGCRQNCRDGYDCVQIFRDGAARFLCDCNASACPNGQTCRRPVGTPDDRCQCTSDANCRTGGCVIVPDQHNYCTW